MIGRVDIEGSKNNVALNALLSDLAASEPKPPGKKTRSLRAAGTMWSRVVPAWAQGKTKS